MPNKHMKKKVEIQKSKKLQKAQKQVDEAKLYSISDAIALVKKTSYTKFDGTVEAHFNVDIDTTSGDQNVRTTVSLPHGTGKSIKVAVFSTGKVKEADLSLGEEDIAKIESGKLKPKVDFEVLVAEPSFVPKLAKIAKILGPAGMMPNPKTGTVSTEPEKAVAELKKGKIELRNEPSAPIIHTRIGKVSFEAKALQANFLEVLKALRANKPQKADPNWILSCSLSATMGPGVKVDLNQL